MPRTRLALAVLLFACQSCMTSELWRDPVPQSSDDVDRVRIDQAPLLSRRCGEATKLVVPVTQPMAKQLSAFVPGLAANATEVVLEPTCCEDTWEAFVRRPTGFAYLWLWPAADGEAPRIELQDYVYDHFSGLSYLPCVAPPAFLRPDWVRLPCRIAWQPAPLAPLLPSGLRSLFVERVAPASPSTARRILWTPVAVLADAVTMPLQLLELIHYLPWSTTR